MRIIPWPAAMLLVVLLLTGCQSAKVATPSENVAALTTRNNCYSLLYQLLDEEKDVSLLRFIKSEPPDVKKLINKIADQSATGAAMLKKFAKEDPGIKLDEIQLPPGEVSTRDAIAATKKKDLLGAHGDAFTLTLLLTQTEALNYGWHLAQVTEENEPNHERASALAGLSGNLQNLYQETFSLLLSKMKSSATNSTSASAINRLIVRSAIQAR